MINMTRVLAIAVLAIAVGGCWGDNGQYLHRSDTITLSAGDAPNINAATHVIDPWPPRVANRRIPANGERMVHAAEKYRGQAAQPAGTPAAPPAVTPSAATATPPATLPY